MLARPAAFRFSFQKNSNESDWSDVQVGKDSSLLVRSCFPTVWRTFTFSISHNQPRWISYIINHSLNCKIDLPGRVWPTYISAKFTFLVKVDRLRKVIRPSTCPIFIGWKTFGTLTFSFSEVPAEGLAALTSSRCIFFQKIESFGKCFSSPNEFWQLSHLLPYYNKSTH